MGELLRQWRQRRRLSQLDLALEAGVSARHLSFLETGRSRPSREMVLHLSEQLDVPLRERNRLLLVAGFAPAFEERPIDAPEMAPVRRTVKYVASISARCSPFSASVSSVIPWMAGLPRFGLSGKTLTILMPIDRAGSTKEGMYSVAASPVPADKAMRTGVTVFPS